MKRSAGIVLLLIINASTAKFFIEYIIVSGSLLQNNWLGITFEPSGMQLTYYYLSLPIFYILSMLSIMHAYIFDLKKSLISVIFLLWVSNILLISIVNLILHFSYGNKALFFGTSLLTVTALVYLILITKQQIFQILRLKEV